MPWQRGVEVSVPVPPFAEINMLFCFFFHLVVFFRDSISLLDDEYLIFSLGANQRAEMEGGGTSQARVPGQRAAEAQLGYRGRGPRPEVGSAPNEGNPFAGVRWLLGGEFIVFCCFCAHVFFDCGEMKSRLLFVWSACSLSACSC